jgi:MFS family permease
MTIEKNLKLIGLYAFLSNALFIVPTLLPFYKEHIGVGYQGLLLGESAFAAACILFDVPTGWVSDVWRRKNTLMLASAVYAFGLSIYLFAHCLWQALVAEIFIGIGYSLFNGTHTAMLYDTLLSLGRTDEYRKREGKRQALSLYGVAFAGSLGGLLYSVNNYLPLLCAIGAQLIALVVAGALHEPERHKRLSEKHPVIDIFETVKYVVQGHAEIGVIIVTAATLFSATKIIMWSQQPYFLALDLPKPMYGVLMAGGWVLGGISSQVAHLLDGKIDNFRALAFGYVAAICVCISAGAYLGYSGIALLMLGGSCIYGIMSPRVNEVINRNIGSDRRATILSTLSLLNASFFIPISAVIGWATDKGTIQIGMFALAAWMVIAAGPVLLLKTLRIKPQLNNKTS